MNYYEKIIQEKKNYKIFGMDGDQYESRHISEYARKFADGLKKGLISESQIVTNLIIDYGWGRKNAEKVAEEAKKIARHNSKEEKGFYQSIIENKRPNTPFWSKEKLKEFNETMHKPNPEDSMYKLQMLKPVVEAFKRKGMSKQQVIDRLKQEKDLSSILAEQCADAWY